MIVAFAKNTGQISDSGGRHSARRRGRIEKRAAPRTYEASAMPRDARRKRGAAIILITNERDQQTSCILLRTSSERRKPSTRNVVATSTNRGRPGPDLSRASRRSPFVGGRRSTSRHRSTPASRDQIGAGPRGGRAGSAAAARGAADDAPRRVGAALAGAAARHPDGRLHSAGAAAMGYGDWPLETTALAFESGGTRVVVCGVDIAGIGEPEATGSSSGSPRRRAPIRRRAPELEPHAPRAARRIVGRGGAWRRGRRAGRGVRAFADVLQDKVVSAAGSPSTGSSRPGSSGASARRTWPSTVASAPTGRRSSAGTPTTSSTTR